MQAVNIIIIGFNLGSIECECLQCILYNTKYPYLITYYDNHKNKYTLTQIWNELIEASPCEYICLLNNDTRVQEGWLKKLVHTLENSYQCAFVGPSTNNCHSPQKTIPSPDDAKRSKYKNVAVHMEDPMSGFCLLFRKSLWEELGGFDAKYKHYGQESDFIDRAHEKGWLSYWRQDAFVYHIGEASVKKSGLDVTAARKEAKKLYWSTRK